eukprot:12111633-Alexandrium_andersonii.AAC.1
MNQRAATVRWRAARRRGRQGGTAAASGRHARPPPRRGVAYPQGSERWPPVRPTTDGAARVASVFKEDARTPRAPRPFD